MVTVSYLYTWRWPQNEPLAETEKHLLKTTANVRTIVKKYFVYLCFFSQSTSNLILDYLFNIVYFGLTIACDTATKAEKNKSLRAFSFPILHIVENYITGHYIKNWAFLGGICSTSAWCMIKKPNSQFKNGCKFFHKTEPCGGSLWNENLLAVKLMGKSIFFFLRIALFVDAQICLLGEVYGSLLFSKHFCFLTVPLSGQQSEQKRELDAISLTFTLLH